MTAYKEWQAGRLLMGKLKHGSDLLEELTLICKRQNLRSGWLTALGAVSRARIAYYHQKKRVYRHRTLSLPLEIINLTGNISLKEGQIMLHAHIALADAKGRIFGGHLAPGTTVFACEFTIHEYAGTPFTRTADRTTGLTLWDITGNQ